MLFSLLLALYFRIQNIVSASSDCTESTFSATTLSTSTTSTVTKTTSESCHTSSTEVPTPEGSSISSLNCSTPTTRAAEMRPSPLSLICDVTGLPNQDSSVLIQTDVPGSTKPSDCALACLRDPHCISFGAVFGGAENRFQRCDMYSNSGGELLIESVLPSSSQISPSGRIAVEIFWDYQCWTETLAC